MSNWSTASKVQATIRAGDPVENVRGLNRGKILSAANCEPPLDTATAEKLGIKINVNWGELLELLSTITGQLLSAFWSNQYFFTVKLPKAPAEHQSEWESFITTELARIMRKNLEYFEVHNARWSSVSAYGVGAMVWRKNDHWLPDFCALADLRIPTDTVISFKNLNWFARRVMYTPLELMDEVFNDEANNHWEKKSIARILKNYKELNFTDASNNYDIETSPEKYLELIHQNGGFYGSDAVPAIPLYHFYFRDGKRWFMRVVPETGVVKDGAVGDKFLWESDTAVASSWEELLHCQFANLATDPPFKFHAVRGPGYILLEPTYWMNLTRCRLLQHVHDNFNIWLKSTDNQEKARVQIQEFGNLGVLKQGLSVVPQAERHQIETQLVDAAFAQLTQLQSKASAQYTQQADTGTDKEQTAFETRVKMEQVNAMMGMVLLKAFIYEAGAHREICRRFCLKDSADPDIQEFQKNCLEAQIPQVWLDVKQWVVEPVTPLGMGNPTIAQAAAQQLMGIRPMMNPTAQNEVLHENILVITKDPRKAARWAPLAGKTTESDAKREAVGLFGTLMTGVPVPLSESNLIDQIDALMPLFAGIVTMITQRDNMATEVEARGLVNVGVLDSQPQGHPPSYLQRAIAALAQDKQQAARVKQYTDALGKLSNEAKALIQRGVQARQKQAQNNGNGHAAELEAKLKGQQAETTQRMAHKEMEFKAEQRRKDAEHRAEQRRKDAEAYTDIEHGRFKAMAEAHNSRMKSFNEPKGENE